MRDHGSRPIGLDHGECQSSTGMKLSPQVGPSLRTRVGSTFASPSSLEKRTGSISDWYAVRLDACRRAYWGSGPAYRVIGRSTALPGIPRCHSALSYDRVRTRSAGRMNSTRKRVVNVFFSRSSQPSPLCISLSSLLHGFWHPYSVVSARLLLILRSYDERLTTPPVSLFSLSIRC